MRSLQFILRFTACLAALGGLSRLFAQTPSIIVSFKLYDYRQSSATDLSVATPSYGLRVIFPFDVPASTLVQLVGPVTLTVPRLSGSTYDLLRGYATEAALDGALPDGNYSVVVTGGGASSTTPLVINSRFRFQPPLITNFSELQALPGGPFRVAWQPIADSQISDGMTFSVLRGSQTVHTSPGPGQTGSLNARSTSYNVPTLDIAAGETLSAFIVMSRYAFATANAGATNISSGVGCSVNFPLRRATLSPPAIVNQPQSLRVAAGSTAVLNVEVAGTGLTYQWRKGSALISGATNRSLILANIQPGEAGVYSVLISNLAGSVTSANAAIEVAPADVPSRIVNLAIRTISGSGAQTLIVGFVIGGGVGGGKPLLVRAVGPALAAFGLPGTLADPRLELFSTNARVAENDNWGGSAQLVAVNAAVGAFALSPPTSLDAALYVPGLASAAYSAQISGTGGTSGIVLAEVYDATPAAEFTAATPRLVNVSARSTVGTGGDILIAGFVIAGPTARTVLIRAIGPALTGFGVAGALVDPQLTLFSGSTSLLSNDDWGGSAALAAEFSRVGAFALPAASRDAALLVTLPPGSYSAQLSGAGGATGIGLVEVYEVP